ncbi:MAG: hypothetical protein KA436_02925 [Oligoflexales bacterium]|nr:hypothetical protein [Oligoflexales bacterium]
MKTSSSLQNSCKSEDVSYQPWVGKTGGNDPSSDSSRELKIILHSMVSKPQVHAAWLNSLSQLELAGAQKISAYLGSRRDLSSSLLQHAAEEFRHAYFFKKKAEQFCKKQALLRPNMILGRVGLRYLHLLDLGISRYCREEKGLHEAKLKQASYLGTTYAIEMRAMSVYPLYEQVLKEAKQDLSLASLIREERAHLHQIKKEIGACVDLNPQTISDFIEIEQPLFSKVLEEIKGYVYGST